jgi:hypothetical protein
MTLQHRLNGYKRSKYKTIDFAGHALEVYVPTRSEMTQLESKCQDPPNDLVDERYRRLTESLWRGSKEGDEGIKTTEDDVFVQGQSLKQTARWLSIMELRERAMIGLIGFREGDDLFALGYDEIAETFSEGEIRDLVAAVEAVVKPSYKATEKN